MPPQLVEGTVDSSYQWISRESGEEPVRNLSPYTAALLQNFMLASVQEGTSEKYAPAYGRAGAKTATAQTGRFDENGLEKVHSWFAGFYPYDSPQYVIVRVLGRGNRRRPHLRTGLSINRKRSVGRTSGDAKSGKHGEYVGLSKMCYRLRKANKTCLGERQESGRMGKLL